MSFTWPLDPQDLFVERYPQMTLGLPADEVDVIRATVTEMWPDRPGSWVYEWSALAARHAEAGSPRLAAQAYGWAKFPSLADDPKRTALARQVEQYALAAPGFPVEFERRTLTVPYRGGEATLPIHLIASPACPLTRRSCWPAAGWTPGRPTCTECGSSSRSRCRHGCCCSTSSAPARPPTCR